MKNKLLLIFALAIANLSVAQSVDSFWNSYSKKSNATVFKNKAALQNPQII